MLSQKFLLKFANQAINEQIRDMFIKNQNSALGKSVYFQGVNTIIPGCVYLSYDLMLYGFELYMMTTKMS